MKKTRSIAGLALIGAALCVCPEYALGRSALVPLHGRPHRASHDVPPGFASGEGAFVQVSGKEFDSAVPKDFYLEGNAIPTEKRNAVLLKTPAGARLLFALIDTTGYSSQIKKKYIGMAIVEGAVSVGGVQLGAGSYGFGLDRPAPNSSGDARFFLYNQAGEKVGDCATKKDAEIKLPRPLQLVLGKGEPARLYLGRYWVTLAAR
jgi:hypothetical protein